jgi:tRNA(His) guanylyltransferase
MKFDELDKRMRIYETAHDHCVLPGVHIVARLDGRNFTRLTKDEQSFDAPFDARFRDLMLETVQHLMQVGFKVLYGYTESDEISLLFALEEDGFGRKPARSTRCSPARPARASPFRSARWRASTAASASCRRNRTSSTTSAGATRTRTATPSTPTATGACAAKGSAPAQATQQLSGMSTGDKNELLFQRGINFNELPLWQKRGIGVLWGELRERGAEPKDRRAHRGRAPPPAHRARAAHGRRV